MELRHSLEPEHRRHLVRLLLAWPAVRKRTRRKYVLAVLQRCPPSSRQAHEASAVEAFRLHGQPGVEEDLEPRPSRVRTRSEEHTSELQSRSDLVCRLLLEKKKNK